MNKVIATFPECIIYTSQKGKEGLFSEKLNFSRYSGNPFIYQYDNISIIEDCNTVELFPNTFMHTINMPGHDWSCLTFHCGDHLFAGDSFLPDCKLMTKFSKSDKVQAKELLLKIKNMINMSVKMYIRDMVMSKSHMMFMRLK